MINYIKGELYRLSHKKSSYIYYTAIFGGFIALIALIFMTGGTFDKNDLFDIGGQILISMFAPFIGINVFMNVYNDDISAKTISNTLNSGISKGQYVISKFIVAMIQMILITLVGAFVYFVMYLAIAGGVANIEWNHFKTLALLLVPVSLMILTYFSITTIVTFFFQKTGTSITVLFLFTMSVLYQVVSLIFSAFSFLEPLTKYLPGYIYQQGFAEIMKNGAISLPNTLGLIAYIILAIAVSSYVLNKKEIAIS